MSEIQNIYVSRDASGWEVNPTLNDNGVVLQVQGYQETGLRERFCVHYNHNELPPRIASIDQATLYLYCKASSSVPTVGLYRITANWTETGVTWNAQPAHGSLIVNINGGAVGWRTANITTAFRYWWNGTWTNYGMKGKYPSETGNNNTIHWWSDTGTYPSYIRVTYTLLPPLPVIGAGVGNPVIL